MHLTPRVTGCRDVSAIHVDPLVIFLERGEEMQEVTAYKCDYCEKWLRSKSGMYKHEGACLWNPKFKACASCKHNVEYEIKHDYEDMCFDTGAREVKQSINKSRRCDKLDFDLFLPDVKLRKDCCLWSGR